MTESRDAAAEKIDLTKHSTPLPFAEIPGLTDEERTWLDMELRLAGGTVEAANDTGGLAAPRTTPPPASGKIRIPPVEVLMLIALLIMVAFSATSWVLYGDYPYITSLFVVYYLLFCNMRRRRR